MTQHLQLSMLADHVMQIKSLDASGMKHLDSCPHCRSDIRWLEQLGALREFEPPKSAVTGVVNTFRTKRDAA
jgi:hypothetical protein